MSIAIVILVAPKMKCVMVKTANACANPALRDVVVTVATMHFLGIRLAASAFAMRVAPRHDNAIQSQGNGKKGFWVSTYFNQILQSLLWQFHWPHL